MQYREYWKKSLILILLVLFLLFFTLGIYLSIFLVWPYFSILIIAIAYLLNLISSFFILFHQRHYDAKVSWLLTIIILPFAGQILFLIFGRRYANRMNNLTYLTNKKQIYNDDFLGSNSFLPIDQIYFGKISSMFQSKPKNFNGHFISDGIKFFSHLIFDLKKAQKYIHIEIYIIKNSFFWQQIKQILRQKAQEGIEVRIICDGFGTYTLNRKEWKELRSYNIEIVVYNKIIFPLIHAKSFYRIHKKTFIIDGKIAYTGGSNIGDEYLSYNKGFGYWIDSNIKLEGEIVRDFALDFLYSWKRNKGILLDKNIYAPLIIKPNQANYGALIEGGPMIDISFLENYVIQTIYKAHRKIDIFTPYFIPTQRIFIALKESLLAGVEVNIYVPGRNDKVVLKAINRYYCETLAKLGANIYQSKNIFMHAKAIIIDKQIGCLGTMNFDVRSMYSQYEINVVSQGKMINDFLNYFENLKKAQIFAKIDYENTKKQNIFIRFLINLFKPMF